MQEVKSNSTRFKYLRSCVVDHLRVTQFIITFKICSKTIFCQKVSLKRQTLLNKNQLKIKGKSNYLESYHFLRRISNLLSWACDTCSGTQANFHIGYKTKLPNVDD
jgi:hypothetical protein